VEAIKPIDDIVEKGAFMGIEKDYNYGITVAPGLGLGVEAGHPLYKEFMEYYSTYTFTDETGKMNLKTIVAYTTEILFKHGLANVPGIQTIEGIYIYPSEYFCPRDVISKRFHITENTRTIHLYAGSWNENKKKKMLKKKFRSLFPESVLHFIYNIKTNNK
jgi:mannosyltransferase OCH1-like enzyme